jgi:hypothetical protein
MARLHRTAASHGAMVHGMACLAGTRGDVHAVQLTVAKVEEEYQRVLCHDALDQRQVLAR